MSQDNLVTVDTNGAAYIEKVNAALQAQATNQSGSGDPSTMYGYQFKIDTAPLPDNNAIYYIRTGDNSAWQRWAEIDKTTGRILIDAASMALLLAAANEFTASQKLKGDALLWRFKDTGGSGVEWGIRSDGGNLELCENTGTEGTPTWTVRQVITSSGIQSGTSKWTALVATTDFSTTPASTSTVTMNTNQLANIVKGYALRYKQVKTAWAAATTYVAGDIRRWGTDNSYLMKCTTGGESAGSEPSATGLYIGKSITDNAATWEVIDRWEYGHTVDMASGLLTLAGVALATGGANLTALEYSPMPSQPLPLDLSIDGYYADATDSNAFYTDMRRRLVCTVPRCYIVDWVQTHITPDTSTEPNVNVMVNGQPVSSANTNAGPAMSASADTEVTNGVNINVTNYDWNYGERLDVKVTKNGNGDAVDLTLLPVIVFP